MGEMADWIIDQIIEGMIDEEEDAIPSAISCKYCGKRGLVWYQFDDTKEWRLFDANENKLHKCETYERAKSRGSRSTRRK